MTEKTYLVVAAGTAWIDKGAVVNDTTAGDRMELHWKMVRAVNDDDAFFQVHLADNSCVSNDYDFDVAMAATIEKHNKGLKASRRPVK